MKEKRTAPLAVMLAVMIGEKPILIQMMMMHGSSF